MLATKRAFLILFTVTISLSGTSFVEAGELEPPGAPSTGTMHTLEEIYTLQQRIAEAIQPITDAVKLTPDRVQCGLQFITLDKKGILAVVSGQDVFNGGDGTVSADCLAIPPNPVISGLKWLRLANCFGKADWHTAVEKVDNLQDGECGLKDGSEPGDWRLATPEEWAALIDLRYTNPALGNLAGDSQASEGNPFFGVQHPGLDPRDISLGYYWSSESDELTVPSDPTKYLAFYVHLGSGVIHNIGLPKEGNALFIWPVRR